MLDLTPPPSAILNRNIAKSCWYFPRYPSLFYDFMRWFYSNSILASALALYVLKKNYNLRAETFTSRNFRVFRVFWSISRKFMPLKILNHQNAKVFSPKIIDILFECDFFTVFWCFSTFFHVKTKNILKNAKFFSTIFVPKIKKRESFCQIFRVF